jgi:hypothetical protein
MREVYWTNGKHTGNTFYKYRKMLSPHTPI